MLKVGRNIIINNSETVINYLAPFSEKNFKHKLDKLMRKLPEGFDPNVLQKFYKKTGLKLRVEYYKGCEVTTFDRKGRYPREDAAIWNREFMKKVSKHPEWLEPQEQPDIVVELHVDGELEGVDEEVRLHGNDKFFIICQHMAQNECHRL